MRLMTVQNDVPPDVEVCCYNVHVVLLEIYVTHVGPY
jgi:hypothetical protein